VTSVLIVDDQELIRTGLELVLGGGGVDVLGQAGNGREAIGLTRKLDPDVVLLDIRMPVLDGVAATRDLTKIGVRARVLILTTYGADRFVYEALRAGAAGFLLKTTPPRQLVTGIETVAAGESLLAPSLTRRLIEEHLRRPPPYEQVPPVLGGLTQRELEVFTMISRGLPMIRSPNHSWSAKPPSRHMSTGSWPSSICAVESRRSSSRTSRA
jgi:DNA-binding NarL/FixJ family response regulator